MRGSDPTFVQAAQPSVEIFLDRRGDNPFWCIEIDKRMVYHMLPNPHDPDYNKFPNMEGTWDATDAKPGD
jgi:hypothetical protein